MTHSILGISAFYHDAAACLVQDGDVVAAVQEERFTRRKHDPRFPARAIRYCLEEGGVRPNQLSRVVFYDKPWLKFERLLETYLAYAPRGLRSFLTAMPVWLKEKLWMEDRLRKEMEYEGEVLFPEHHQSHAASAFYPSPFEDAAILTLDAVGEWATSAWGVGTENRIQLQREIRFPHSLGLLYSAFTYYLGFRVNSGEYKMMGLAPYGEPRYADRILDELLDLKDDGSFRLNMDYFEYPYGLTMTSEAFHRLFEGPRRDPGEPLRRRHMDLARSIQDVTEEVILRMARHVRRETGLSRLCMAGGVALNCVANGRILREEIFEDLWIQPAAGDAGGALGAALFGWHQLAGGARSPDGSSDAQKGSRLGPAFAPRKIREWLREREIPHHPLPEEERVREAARLLDEGKVVGWFSGRMEYGPRALGGRSILADPRDPRMQSTLNRKIKGRESFRPFAPSCLREEVSEYFELDRDSPYMLLVAPVREDRRRTLSPDEEAIEGTDAVQVARSDLPAVTHVDHSSRIQTVKREDHPRYHRLLRAFRERTGCGVVVNTSFNVSGEPIVCTPSDAYRCFMRTGMDALVLEDSILYGEEQPRHGTDDAPAFLRPATEGRRVPTEGAALAAEDEGESRRTPRSPEELRRFGLVMAGALGVLGGISLWRDFPRVGGGLIAVAALFAIGGLSSPTLLRPVERGWMWLAEKLSVAATFVLLTLTYLLAVTPLGMMGRLAGRDRLRLRGGPEDSHWIAVDPDGPASRPEKPF